VSRPAESNRAGSSRSGTGTAAVNGIAPPFIAAECLLGATGSAGTGPQRAVRT
jgi:hypothetical protein